MDSYALFRSPLLLLLVFSEESLRETEVDSWDDFRINDIDRLVVSAYFHIAKNSYIYRLISFPIKDEIIRHGE